MTERVLLRDPRTNLQDEAVPTIAQIQARVRRERAECARLVLIADKPKPPTPHKPYTPQDDAAIRQGRQAGVPYTVIAEQIDRTPGGVQHRAAEIGVTVQGAQGQYKRKRIAPAKRIGKGWTAWTAEDNEELMRGRDAGRTYEEIAVSLGRREMAVRAHVMDLRKKGAMR